MTLVELIEQARRIGGAKFASEIKPHANHIDKKEPCKCRREVKMLVESYRKELTNPYCDACIACADGCFCKHPEQHAELKRLCEQQR